MTVESVEARLARIDERWNIVVEELRDAKTSRKSQYDSTEALSALIAKIDSRVANVETALASAKPTIEEFITIKHKVVGAGIAGKWLWAAGGALLGLAATSREAIFHWLSKGS